MNTEHLGASVAAASMKDLFATLKEKTLPIFGFKMLEIGQGFLMLLKGFVG